MARPLRIEYEGAFYHVFSRGNDDREIFLDDQDRVKFLNYLEDQVVRYGIKIHSYCLMDNHYHLIIETPHANLSKAMHTFDTSYSVYFNNRHKKYGHLFQGRYKSTLVQADEYLHYLSCYIHLNPVRAKIVKDPIYHKWSSYQYYVTEKKPPPFLTVNFILSMFSQDIKKSRVLYKIFVIQNIGKEAEIIKKNTVGGVILGSPSFVDWVKGKFLKNKQNSEVPALKRLRTKIDVEEIRSKVNELIKDTKLGRKIEIYLIRKYTDKKLLEITQYYHKQISYAGISMLCNRVNSKRKENSQLDRLITKIENMLNVKI